jgi:3'-5' exoribonuclease
MSEEFGQLVRSIENRHVRETVKRTFRTDGLYRAFKVAPLEGAGYGAWVGGALEHTIRIARLIVSACETQPEIDRDLVLAAALLHQVGAVDATTGAPRIQQTVRGRLVPRGVLSVMHLQAGFGAPESRSSFHHRLEELVLHSTPKSESAVSGGEPTPSSLEYAVLSGAIEMAYAVGARAEISRSHMAPVVPLRRVG